MTDDTNWIHEVHTSPRMAILCPSQDIVARLSELLGAVGSDRPMTPNEVAVQARALLAASRAGARGEDSE